MLVAPMAILSAHYRYGFCPDVNTARTGRITGSARIVYGNTKDDAKAINFHDAFIYGEIAKAYVLRAIPCQNFMRKEALAGFRAWAEKEDKIEY